MAFEFHLNRLLTKAAVALLALSATGLLIFIVTSNFIKAALADERSLVDRSALGLAVDYFPTSARLNARAAEEELGTLGRDLARAARYAERAAGLSPYNFNYRLLLASVREAEGDRAAAERELRAAVGLAPNNAGARYRLANLLVRQGRLASSLDEFRVAASYDDALLASSLDLVWQASGGSFAAVEAITGERPGARMTLARCLVRQGRPREAAAVFARIEPQARKALPESPAFLTALVSAGEAALARGLWLETIGAAAEASERVSNSSFEDRILKDFAHFDWVITQSDYARVSLDSSTARAGGRSLRLDFTGRDTTKLDNEVRQMVVVRPGAKYRVECFVKTEDFFSPEGPRVVVTTSSSEWVAASEPIAAGSGDWEAVRFDFTAPENAAAVFLSLKRKPRFSYDEPTRGRLWLDDFKLSEQP
jgi:tetratricopeptide (TPR) repeat protein